MGIEIERKFLVTSDAWRQQANAREYIRQGYVHIGPDTVMRIRMVSKTATLTLKKKTGSLKRNEFEYTIPVEDAEWILAHICLQPIIEKIRHTVWLNDTVFEIDEFQKDNEGLIVAEIELEHENDPVPQPKWLGEDVSHDPKYLNAELVKNPYSAWGKND